MTSPHLAAMGPQELLDWYGQVDEEAQRARDAGLTAPDVLLEGEAAVAEDRSRWPLCRETGSAA